MQAAEEVTSRSKEHAGKQQIIASVLWKHRLVVAIQQLYKLLYKSFSEAKQLVNSNKLLLTSFTAAYGVV